MPKNNIVTTLIYKKIPTLPNQYQYIFPKTLSLLK